jgi:hypothetical protein
MSWSETCFDDCNIVCEGYTRETLLSLRLNSKLMLLLALAKYGRRCYYYNDVKRFMMRVGKEKKDGSKLMRRLRMKLCITEYGRRLRRLAWIGHRLRCAQGFDRG